MLFTPPTYGGKFYVCPRSTTPTPTSSSSSDNNPKRTGSNPTGPNASASAVANANVKASLNQLPPIGEGNTTTTTTSVKDVEVVEDPLNPRRGVQEGTRYGMPLKGFASEDPSGKTIPVLVYDVYHIRSPTPRLHPFVHLYICIHIHSPSLNITVLLYVLSCLDLLSISNTYSEPMEITHRIIIAKPTPEAAAAKTKESAEKAKQQQKDSIRFR